MIQITFPRCRFRAETHRLAKNMAGAPAVLISVSQLGRRHRPAPVRLENLSVEHDLECRLTRQDGRVEQDYFTVLGCRSNDIALYPHFLRIVAPLLSALGARPSRAAVDRLVSSLVSLFRTLSNAPANSVQGLWAELFVIRQSRAPAELDSRMAHRPSRKLRFQRAGQKN